MEFLVESVEWRCTQNMSTALSRGRLPMYLVELLLIGYNTG